MPSYTINIPGHGSFTVDSPEDLTDAQAYYAITQQYPQVLEPVKEGTAGFGEAIAGSTKRMLSSGRTALTAPLFDSEAAGQAGLAGLRRQEQIKERPGASLEEVKRKFEEGFVPGVKEVVSQIPGAIGEFIPQAGSMFATGRLGAMAGAPFGPVGATVGGIGGALLGSFLPQTGSDIERQAQEDIKAGRPVDVSMSKALGAGAGQAALDYAGLALGGVGRFLGIPMKKLGTETAEKMARESILKAGAKGTAQFVAGELPTEIAQQMLERYQADLPLTTPDALKEYYDVAYQTALMGPAGGGARILGRPSLPSQPSELSPPTVTPSIAPAPAAPTITPTGLAEPTTSPLEEGLATTAAFIPETKAPEITTPTALAEEAVPTEMAAPSIEVTPPTELAPLTSLPNVIDDETIQSFGFKPRTIAYKRMQEIDPTTPEGQELFDKVVENNARMVKTDENIQAVNQFKSLIAEHNRLQEVPSAGADIRAIGTSIRVPGEPADTGRAEVAGEPIGGGVVEYRADLGRPEARTEPEYGALEPVVAEEFGLPVAEKATIVAPEATEVLPTAEELKPEEVSYAENRLAQIEKEGFADKTADELDALEQEVDQLNHQLDMYAIRKHMGEAAAQEYEAKSRRGRDNWWYNNVTEGMSNDSAETKGVDPDAIKEYRRAVNDFDIESAFDLGKSIALKAKNVAQPNYVGSPDYVAVRNALRYAKDKGWNINEIRKGMATRASEWGGSDAAELFKDLFKDASSKPQAKPAQQKPASVSQEARKLAIKLQKIDPYHPDIPLLRSPSVTEEDVAAAKEELTGLEKVARVPTVEDPLEKQIKDVKSNIGLIASDLFEPKAEIVEGPRSTIGDLMKAIGDLMFLLIKKGIRGAGRVIKGTRDSLGRHANKVTPKQYQQAYQEAEMKHATEPEAEVAAPVAEGVPEEDLFYQTATLAPPSLDKSTESFVDKMVNFEGENLNRTKLNEWATKARIELAYSGAGVEEALKEKYSGQTAIDNALTKEIRADILQTQALKGKSLAAESAAKGYATIDDLGVTRVVEDKNNLAAFMGIVKDLGDRIGMDRARHAVQAYMTATRYQSWLELNKTRKEELYVSPEQQAAIEPALKFGEQFPEIKQAAAIYESVKNREVDLLEQAGIYSAEQADLYRKTKGYVPFFRVMDDIENAAPGAKQYFRGFTDIPAEKHATGSARQVDDIFNNMVTRHMWAVEASMRNRANLAQANQLGLTNDKGDLIMTDRQVEGTEGYSAPVWFEGKRKWVQYSDPNFVVGLEGLEPALGPVMQFFGSASRILRMGVTLLPTFQITQVFNDAPRAALYSGVDRPFKLMGQVLDSFKTVLTDPNDPFVKQMKALGVTGGYEQSAIDVANKLRREMGTQSTSKVQKFLDKLERIASASDMAQRRALFKQTMEETGNEALALDRALNIINFQKHGKNAKVRALTQVVPFMNAYIQGMDVMLSAMSGRGISNKQKQIAKMMFLQTGIKLAAISALYSMLVAGDDDYEKLDDREKVRSLIIPGTGFSIPVASDIGMLVKAIPELTYNYIVREGTDNPMDSTKLFKGIGQSFADGLLGPNITPQAFRAGIEVALNRNFLTGNPIVGRGLENLETSQQFTENTSRLARLIGETGILSPMNADHLMKGYGGTAASLVLFMMDGMINQVADVKTPSTPLNKIPGIGAFVYSDQGKDQLNDYYDLKERSDEVTATLNNLRKYGSPEEAREYAKENIEMLQVRNQVNAINNRIKAMRDIRKKIIGSDMSADEKAQRIEEIDKNILNAVQNIGKIRVRAGL